MSKKVKSRKASKKPAARKSLARKTVAKAAPAKKRAANGVGRSLIAKKLPEKTWKTMHAVPHGQRQRVLHGIFKAFADYAVRTVDWHKYVLAGKIRVSSTAITKPN